MSRLLDVLDSVRAGWAVDRARRADLEAENARLRAQLADALSAPPALFVFESGVTDARVVAGAVSAPS
ncbi:hypothetical protein [Pseudonocardia sediminis]|uniref:hypothetical protein n=1 Tax=Pseudonocardia sediminis TaxID=1397368 RepID=UPI0010293FC2|nr:hypothetical protein [Pseudonocardia sediminis]